MSNASVTTKGSLLTDKDAEAILAQGDDADIVDKLRAHAQMWRGAAHSMMREHAWYCDEAADTIDALRYPPPGKDGHVTEFKSRNGAVFTLEEVLVALEGMQPTYSKDSYGDAQPFLTLRAREDRIRATLAAARIGLACIRANRRADDTLRYRPIAELPDVTHRDVILFNACQGPYLEHLVLDGDAEECRADGTWSHFVLLPEKTDALRAADKAHFETVTKPEDMVVF